MLQPIPTSAEESLPSPYRRAFDRYTIQPERYADVFEQEPLTLCSLEHAHWQEIMGSDEQLRCNRQFFVDQERKSLFCFFTVRDRANSLVGYFRVKLYGDAKRWGTKVAQEDGWYLRPSVRKGRLGLVLLQTVERSLASVGVDELLVGVYHDTRAEALMERTGYEPTFKVFRKKLKD